MAGNDAHILLRSEELAAKLEELAREIYADLPAGVPLGVVGIRSRGEVLAQRLVDALHELGAEKINVGTLDITLYRDDLAERGAQAILRKTEIDFNVDGCYLILVDDVLHTGRSARSAMDALMDLGRPRIIRLAVLVDRPGRELPIQADYVGVHVPREDVPVTVHLTEADGVDEVRVG